MRSSLASTSSPSGWGMAPAHRPVPAPRHHRHRQFVADAQHLLYLRRGVRQYHQQRQFPVEVRPSHSKGRCDSVSVMMQSAGSTPAAVAAGCPPGRAAGRGPASQSSGRMSVESAGRMKPVPFSPGVARSKTSSTLFSQAALRPGSGVGHHVIEQQVADIGVLAISAASTGVVW